MDQMIKIEIQNKDVLDAIDRLYKRVSDLSEPMEQIGEFLHNITSQSFDNEQSPDGEAWHPLADSTKAYKAKYGGYKILQSAYQNTYHSIAHEATDKSVIIGVNAYSGGKHPYMYPLIHQFGGMAGRGKNVKIEARPFMPITRDGELYDNVNVEVLDILLGYLGE